jgi:hypothetical protein
MPIVRHDSTGKVTPRATIGHSVQDIIDQCSHDELNADLSRRHSVQDIIDQCSHDELNADLSRRKTPYDLYLAKLREDNTDGTGE